MHNIVLLSIRPEWASAILAGIKKWEYRKVAPKNANSARIILYASDPVQAIMGEFFVKQVLKEPVDSLIMHTLHETPHTAKDIETYFFSSKECTALGVANVTTYEKPISLKRIREVNPNFVPPQNFIYLKEEDAQTKKILELLPITKHISAQTKLSGLSLPR